MDFVASFTHRKAEVVAESRHKTSFFSFFLSFPVMPHANIKEIEEPDVQYKHCLFCSRKPGTVARSEGRPLGMQAAQNSIPTPGTFFRGDLVMKTFLRPFSLFR